MRPILRLSPRNASPEYESRHGQRRNYVIVDDRRGVGQQLCEMLEARGFICRRVEEKSNSSRGDDSINTFNALAVAINEIGAPNIAGVLFLRSLDLIDSNPEDARTLVSQQVDVLVQLQGVIRLLQSQPQAIPLWVVTNASHTARGVPQAPIGGFARTIALEHPDLFGGCIGLSNEDTSVLAACADEIVAPDRERWIVLGSEGRRVPRLVRCERRLSAGGCRLEGAYVITGGFGDLGIHVGRWLVRRGAKRLIVISRSGMQRPEARQLVDELAGEGAQVVAISADIADSAVVARIQEECRASPVPIRGVVHCAGAIHDGLLVRQSAEEIREVLLPKVAGVLNLRRALAEQRLDFFVLFGSVASVFGSPGQANYAAANAYLDAVAGEWREAGLPMHCANWGPWEGTGMMGHLDANLRERILALGLQTMDETRAIACLEEALNIKEPQLILASINWKAAAQSLGTSHWGTLVEDFIGTLPQLASSASELNAKSNVLAKELRSLPPRERRNRLSRQLQHSIASLLQYPNGALPDTSQGFFSMGLDSLMMVNLLRQMSVAIGVPLSPSVTFENPTIHEMSNYLSEALCPTSHGESLPARNTISEEVVQGTSKIAKYQELTDDEALGLLNLKVATIAKDRST